MKKTIICVCLAFSLNAVSQNTSTVSPSGSNTGVTITPGGGQPETTPRDKTLVNSAPENVVTKFNTDNPGNTNVVWQNEGKNFRATYTDRVSNTERVIIYDQDGNVVRTEAQLDDMTFPPGVSDYYSKNYPNEQYRVYQSNDNSGHRSYYTKRKDEVIWFDQDGNYIPMNKKSNTAPTPPKSSQTKSPENNYERNSNDTKDPDKHTKPKKKTNNPK